MNDFKDYAERSAWTAIETGLAVVIGTGIMDLSVSTLQVAGIAALSAVLTVMSVYVRKKRVEAESRTD